MPGKIVISGSCVAALSMKSGRFPQVGETVAADVFLEETGGKGTNQALSASRLGSNVFLIGCVGDDSYGKTILKTHNDFKVNTDAVRINKESHTGVAFILIDAAGKNMINIFPGSNFQLTQKDFDDNLHIIKDCDIIGFQLEQNVDFVEYGIKRAKDLGVTTLLDPAPARHLDESIYTYLDYVKPNETEASFLTGIQVTDKDSAFTAAEWFLNKGTKNAIITLGEKGVVVLNKQIKKFIAPPKIDAVDPTGAGDIFSGALMHCLADGMNLHDAAEFAVYASAFSVRKLGALTGMPTQQDVIDFRKSF